MKNVAKSVLVVLGIINALLDKPEYIDPVSPEINLL